MNIIRYLFFTIGIVLMFCLSNVGSSISRDILDVMFVKPADFQLEHLSILRGFIAPLLSILYGIAFLYFIRQGNLNPAFNLFLSINIAVWIFCGFATKMEYFNASSLTLSAVYTWLNATSPLLIVLVVGLANQYFTFRYAALFYTLLLIAHTYGIPHTYILKQPAFLNQDASFLWAVVATCGLGILALYHLIIRLPPKQNDNAPPASLFNWLSLFALAYGYELARILPFNFFNKIARAVYSAPGEYNFIGKQLTELVTSFDIYTAIFSILLGLALYFFRTRFYFGIGLFVLAFIFGSGIIEFLAGSQANLNQDNFSLVSLGYAGNKIATRIFAGLIIPLAYFTFNTLQRFNAITSVNFIFFPLAFLSVRLFSLLPVLDGYIYLALFTFACGVCAGGLYKLKQRFGV